MATVLTQLATALLVVFGSYAALVALVVLARIIYISIEAIQKRTRMRRNMYNVREKAERSAAQFCFFCANIVVTVEKGHFAAQQVQGCAH